MPSAHPTFNILIPSIASHSNLAIHEVIRMTSWMGNELVPIDHPNPSLLKITPFIQTKICTSSAFIYTLAFAPLTHSLVFHSPTPNTATVASFRYLNHVQVSSNSAGGPKSNYNQRNQVDCSSAKSFGCQFNLS